MEVEIFSSLKAMGLVSKRFYKNSKHFLFLQHSIWRLVAPVVSKTKFLPFKGAPC